MEVRENLFSFIMGNRCIICDSYSDNFLCSSCNNSIIYYPEQMVIKPTNLFYIDTIYTITYYTNTIKQLIHIYKFKNYRFLSHFFATIIKEKYNQIFDKYDFIIITPLHKSKLIKRGFNQTYEIISKVVSSKKIFKYIKRVKKTKQQSLLDNIEDRKKNIQFAFEIEKNKRSLLKNKKILIFDDIITSGNTANEIAKMLYFCEVTQIDFLTISMV